MTTMNVDARSLEDICVSAVSKMIAEGIEKHIQFIHPDDGLPFDIDFSTKIPKVTIEWVDPSEALTTFEIDELARAVDDPR